MNNRPIILRLYKVVIAGTNTGPWGYIWEHEYGLELDGKKMYFAFENDIDRWIREAKTYISTFETEYELEVVAYHVETIENAVIIDRKQVIIERDKIMKMKEIERRKV